MIEPRFLTVYCPFLTSDWTDDSDDANQTVRLSFIECLFTDRANTVKSSVSSIVQAMDSEEEESLKRALINKLKKINQQNGTQKPQPSPPKTKRQTMTKTPTKEGSLHPIQEPPISTRQLLKLLELERQEAVQSKLNERVNIFKQFDKDQEERNKQARLTAQQAAVDNINSQAKQIIEAGAHYKAQSEMAQLREAALKQMHDRQNLLWAANKKLITEEIVRRISVNILRYYEEMKKMLTLANSLDDNGKPLINNSVLDALNSGVQGLVRKCNTEHNTLSEQDIVTSETILLKAVEVSSTYQSQVADFKLRKQSEKQSQQLPITKQEETVTTNLDKYITVTDLEKYENVLAFAKKFRETFAQLELDSSLKTFRFDCKKAVNVPVNSLSDVNAQHILDKYKKLYSLLVGQPVQTANTQHINAASHPQGVAFCMDLLAKKFVLQGDTMVSSNPESAFPYASVVLSLWNDFPDFGQLVLAYFYQFCPYLVPYHPPKRAGQTEEEYYKQLGYQYSADGVVERQDKFLKRMTGEFCSTLKKTLTCWNPF